MNIQIRSAEAKDLSGILEILNYEILHSTVVYDYREKTLEEIRDWFNKKKKDAFPVLLAETEQKILGYGTYGTFRPWEAFKFSAEHSIYVSKDHRGKGIGKLLMEELILQAKQNKIHSLIGGIDASNTKSYDFHQQFGFQEVGRLKQVGYKFDQWLDMIFMQLILD